MRSGYEKQKRTFNTPFHAHFLTYSCYGRHPLLTSSRSRRWVVDAIQCARRKLNFAVWAYVIMPEHLHVLLYPRNQDYSLGQILASMKRAVSQRAKCHLIDTGNAAWLRRLTIQRGERAVFRFWQAGGGFDRNVEDFRHVESIADYIHHNPVRRGLVTKATDWEWSSARSWHRLGSDPLPIDPVDI